MLNVWPIFATGVEVGLILAIISSALIQICLPYLLQKRRHAVVPSRDIRDR